MTKIKRIMALLCAFISMLSIMAIPGYAEEGIPQSAEETTQQIAEEGTPQSAEETTQQIAEEEMPQGTEELTQQIVEEATPQSMEEPTQQVEEEGTTQSAGTIAPLSSSDSRYPFYWTSSGQIQKSNWREKHDMTRVYQKAFKGTYGGRSWALPYQGYQVRTYSYCQDGECFSSHHPYSSWYKINDYGGKAIAHGIKGHSVSDGISARIETKYVNSTYSSGDVLVIWSPDYKSDGSTLLG